MRTPVVRRFCGASDSPDGGVWPAWSKERDDSVIRAQMLEDWRAHLKQIGGILTIDSRTDSYGASKLLHMSEGTLRNYRCEGKGPQFSKAGKIWYRLDDLATWLLRHRSP